MTAFAYYLLKVIICSGLLTGYYFLALRNRLFHQWNRFYLLAAVLLSLCIPLMEFRFLQTEEKPLPAIEMVGVVQGADVVVQRWKETGGIHLTWEMSISFAYTLICVWMTAILVRSIYRLYRIRYMYTFQLIHQVRFYLSSNIKGTPFSFFRNIFWNPEIDLQSPEGQKILEHEMVHVQENHSADKLLVQTVLSFFWINPFFWLIRKELYAIHEFLADRKAVKDGDTASLAAMILQAAYPNQYNSLTQSFFTSSIKRRILMLSKLQNPKISYAGRVAALPLMALLVMAFTFKTDKINKLEEPLTIVIDAGHGLTSDGIYSGAQYGDVFEDELALSIVKKIASLNTNPNLKIVLSRTDENSVPLQRRVAVADDNRADLFLSIHIAASPNAARSGIEVYTPKNNERFEAPSHLLASALIQNLSAIYPTNNTINTQRATGIWVLDKNPRPSALLELGYMTNSRDLSFIKHTENQTKLAQQILKAIEQYGQQRSGSTLSTTNPAIDTLPEKKITITPQGNTKAQNGKTVASVDVIKPKTQIIITYTDGTKEELTEQDAIKRGLITGQLSQYPVEKESIANSAITVRGRLTDALYIVDGKALNQEEVSKLDPDNIANIDVLKGESATALYGEKGKNGVVLIKTKSGGSNTIQSKEKPNGKSQLENIEVYPVEKNGSLSVDEVVVSGHKRANDESPLFEKTETPPSIDPNEWRKFLEKNLQPFVEDMAAKGVEPDVYTIPIKFVVEKDGSLSDISISEKKLTAWHDRLINLVRQSPRWNPAKQNGKTVRAWHTQPITIVISDGGENNENAITTVGSLKNWSLVRLAGLKQGQDLVSLMLSMELDNGNVSIAHINASNWNQTGRPFVSTLKPGKTLLVESIQVKENGTLKKLPMKIYQIKDK